MPCRRNGLCRPRERTHLRLPAHRTRPFPSKRTQAGGLGGALLGSPLNLSDDLEMTLPWFPSEGPKALRLNDYQEHCGPPYSFSSHQQPPPQSWPPAEQGPQRWGVGRSEPGVYEEKGRAERGLLPRAGQDPQLGKQVCQLMSALAAAGRGICVGGAFWLGDWPTQGSPNALYQSNPLP